MIESTLPAIIGIWHARIIMGAAETDEGLDFFVQTTALVDSLHVCKVGFIHRDD